MNTAKYYYLNEENKPQGPFTLEQLAALKISGAINEKTKVATAGDMSWKALEEQGWMKEGAIPVNQESSRVPITAGVGVEPGHCPKCGTEIKGWTVPVHCAGCGYQLRPSRDTFWSNMLYAGKRLFSLRGRATRMQYWAFCVGMIPIMFLWFILMIGGLSFIACNAGKDNMVDFITNIGIYCSIIYLIMLLPFMCLYGRRCHDLGLSSVWSILYTLCCLVSVVSYFPMLGHATDFTVKQTLKEQAAFEEKMAVIEEKAEAAANEARDRGDEEKVEEIIEEISTYRYEQEKLIEQKISLMLNEELQRQMMSFGPNVIIFIVTSLLTTLGSIFVFIIGFIDSGRGPNKYGPSIKYPRG